MTSVLRGRRAAATCLAGLLLVSGCGQGDGEDQGGPPPPGAAGGMPGGADRVFPASSKS